MSADTTKPVIFLAFANDRDRYLRNLPEEARQLQRVLGEARRAGLCELILRQNVTLQDILDVFQDAEYRDRIVIFHFGGHADDYQLLLESAEGEGRAAYAGGLAAFLGQQKCLDLVFLNGCSTQAQTQGLLEAGVTAVISTSQAIVDKVAVEFATRFYQGLRGGATLRAAYNEAVATIQIQQGLETRALVYGGEAAAEGGLPWGLYLRPEADEPELWTLRAASRPKIPHQPFEPEMILIPAGPFWLGSPSATGEWQRHQVTLPLYKIGRFPVTNEQYMAFVKDNPDRRPQKAGWRFTTPPPGKLNHPVVGVSWHEALAYCQWLKEVTGRPYRLPTEAEWEKAARGDQDSRLYPWGDELSPDRCNYAGSDTTPVGHYPAGQSPYGCYDMAGNIQEWTNTLWGDDWRKATFIYPYQKDKREDWSATATGPRIYRGGGYDDDPAQLGCSARNRYAPEGRDRNLGFRVVLEIT